MKEIEPNRSAASWLAELAKGRYGEYALSVLTALLGVACSLIPYFIIIRLITALVNGTAELPRCLTLCAWMAGCWVLRYVLHSVSTSLSHHATFHVLANTRVRLLDKLATLPLGTVLDRSSGSYKNIIVERVDSIETTLAHLLPEMTANVLGPVCILVYLFVLDWRMALLSLVSIPVGMAFMMAVMAGYGKQYEGSIRTTQAMNSAIVEYIGGIEVIKAFNQGKQSYARFSDSVKANASYFYHWMKSCQLPISLSKAISPTTMITILPVGWLLYAGGSLPVETFITTIVLSLGIAIQNFPEGAIISLPLRAEGMKKSRAFLDGVLSGVVEPIGAVLTILAARHVIPALPYLLSFAAGAMLYVVVEELIPEMSQGTHTNVGTIFFAIGFSLMMVLDVALG